MEKWEERGRAGWRSGSEKSWEGEDAQQIMLMCTVSMGGLQAEQQQAGGGEKKRMKVETGEGNREVEGRMAEKMSMGARMEVAKPGREMELLWVSRQWEGRLQQQRVQDTWKRERQEQSGEVWEVFSRRSTSASHAFCQGGKSQGTAVWYRGQGRQGQAAG